MPDLDSALGTLTPAATISIIPCLSGRVSANSLTFELISDTLSIGVELLGRRRTRRKVDELDRGVLSLLQKNARMPAAEMARRLRNVSARTANNSMRRLAEEGVIAIMAGAVPSALGYSVAANVYVEVVPRKLTEVARALANLNRAVYVALTPGDADLSIQVHAIDIQELRKLITEKVHAFPGVWKTKTFVIMQVVKQTCNWQFPARLP